jgi:uncharacterized protein with NAD-binding domain and iron-sulfur cluster
MTSARKPHVSVVGGGLAGMVAALRLLERGCRVSLYESSDRLGGKAGANWGNGQFNDHGYHIFPMWYRNIWALVSELGIGGNFVDRSEFVELGAGEFPVYKTFRNLTSYRCFWQNLCSGVLSVPEMFLFFYSALDLASQNYQDKALLDQISVVGFIRSRFYRTERVATEYQDMVLKGISVPSYFVSAMTMRQVMRYWVRSAEPACRIPVGNLQEFWIRPIQQRLEKLGCEIKTSHTLRRISLDGATVRTLHFAVSGNKQELSSDVDQAILAIPHGSLARILDDEMYVADPSLFGIFSLQSQPMAALNIYCNRRIPGIPASHVNLPGSRHGLCFIDVSQAWSGQQNTILNLIASDFANLQGLSEKAMIDALLADLQRFLPDLHPRDIRTIDFQSHLNEPLFMNNTGAWQFRPAARTQITNLYVAGDYCRSHIDLVCMEGAVSTGLLAAEALRSDLNLSPPIPLLLPAEYPRWLLVLGKVVLLPIALATWVLATFVASRQKPS